MFAVCSALLLMYGKVAVRQDRRLVPKALVFAKVCCRMVDTNQSLGKTGVGAGVVLAG